MSLEDLERKLYEKNPEMIKPLPGKPRKKDPGALPEEIPRGWAEAEMVRATASEKKDFSLKKLIFFGVGFFILIVAGTVTFLILTGGKGGTNIELSIFAPTSVSRGVPFDITVGVANNSETPIRGANLELTLPPGVINLGDAGSAGTLIREALGDIGTGAVIANKKFKLLPIGDVNSIQKVDIHVTYSTGGSSQFESSETKEITVREPGITLTTRTPDQVLRGGSFDFEIRYKNETDFDFPSVTLAANYPGAFKFESASLNPDTQNNYWRLGELRHGSTGTLTVRGHLEGVDESKFGIPIKLSANFLGQDYVIVEDTVSLTLAPSPIQILTEVNGEQDYIAHTGESLNFSITYQNQSGIALADVVVKASVVGDMVEPGSMTTAGYSDPVTGVITWNAATVPNLRLLQPGASGNVTLAVKLRDLFPIKRLSDKNYSVRVNVKIDSPTVPFYMKADKTSAVASFDTKVGGLVVVDQKGFFRDVQSGIVNLGTFPPRAGEATEYTVHWILKNYGTDVKNISLRGSLEPGVVWTGVVKSNADSVPLYNDRTQEITWTIEKIPATRGVISAPLEAIFQVRAVPSVSTVGQAQPLSGGVVLAAEDDFTGVGLTGQAKAITTNLLQDVLDANEGNIIQ